MRVRGKAGVEAIPRPGEEDSALARTSRYVLQDWQANCDFEEYGK